MTTRLHKLILVLGVALAVGFAVPAAAGTSERAKGAVAPHTAGRPTEKAFISRADAICRRSDDKEAPLIYQAGGDLGGAGPKLLVVLRANTALSAYSGHRPDSIQSGTCSSGR